MKRNQTLKSFTLVEVLVTISLFLIIVVIIYSVQAFSQKVYQRGEVATEIIQNGRVILERISRELRQAKYIVTLLPEISDDPEFPPPAEILFQDGHLLSTFEGGQVQEATSDTARLELTASSEDNYYRGMFITVIDPITKVTQTGEIDGYDGESRTVEIEKSWDTIPTGWNYQIDSSYYYIKYWKDEDNYLRKQIIGYCFPEECNNFIFSPWNTKNPEGQTLYELDSKLILEDEAIGEFLADLKFWGTKVINISLILEKGEEEVELRTKIFGRNL